MAWILDCPVHRLLGDQSVTGCRCHCLDGTVYTLRFLARLLEDDRLQLALLLQIAIVAAGLGCSAGHLRAGVRADQVVRVAYLALAEAVGGAATR